MTRLRPLKSIARRDQHGNHGARDSDRDRRARFSAAAAIGSRGLSLVLSLATVPLALNYLGPERYGMWVTISSMIALLGFTDLGVGNGLINAVTETTARGHSGETRRQISSAAALQALLALTLAGLMAVLYWIVPWPKVLAVSSPLAVSEAGAAMVASVACFLVGQPLAIAAQVRTARQEGYLAHGAAALGNLAAVGALLVVIQTHQGLPALALAMAGPPQVAAAANGLVLFARDAPQLRPSLVWADRLTAIRLLRTGFLFLVLQVAMATAFTSDTLVLAHLIGQDAVAEYGVAYKLFMIPAGIVAMALLPLWPAYGEAVARGDNAWVRRTLVGSIRASLAISLPAAGILVAFGTQFVLAWAGPSVVPTFPLLLGFGVWIVFSGVGNCVAMLLNGAGELRLQAIAAAFMAVANLALSIWLTRSVGVSGVIWGSVISYAAFVLVPMTIYVPRILRQLERRGMTRKPLLEAAVASPYEDGRP